MVLGLRSKHRKGASVQIDYLVHVREISPWPPSQSLRSVQSVLLQWENGDQNTGSLTSSVGNANIDFNVAFTLPLTLCREKRSNDKFQKNLLEFFLYETRKDKLGKGQILGTAIVNLADYGIIEDIVTISALLNCKKISKNAVQPVLSLKLQPVDKSSSSSSPKISLSKDVSLDKDGQDSVSKMMNERNDEESEIASFTDDDVSSHSSLTVASSAFEAAEAAPVQNEKVVLESAIKNKGREDAEHALPLVIGPSVPIRNPWSESFKYPSVSSHTSSLKDNANDLGNPVNNLGSLSVFPQENMASINKKYDPPLLQSSFSSLQNRESNGGSKDHMKSFKQEYTSNTNNFEEKTLQSAEESIERLAARDATPTPHMQVGVSSDFANPVDGQFIQNGDELVPQQITSGQVEVTALIDLYVDRSDGKEKVHLRDISHDETRHVLGKNVADSAPQTASRKQVALKSTTLTSSGSVVGVQRTPLTNSKLKHVKSVQLPSDASRADVYHGNGQSTNKVKKIGCVEPTNGSEKKNEWKNKAEMLEEELREAAALEVGLYSIVAEHGSSINKVHAPARRLSRFYLHSCKAKSRDKRATAARTAISGLILVSKACGNDVPRLAFWLSNAIMLRAIVSKAVQEISRSDESSITNSGGNDFDVRSLRKWDKSSSNAEGKSKSTEEFDDWEDPMTFTIALERVEAWIFSRIVESVWWQALTPHMQPTTAKNNRNMGSSSRKTNGSRHVLRDQEQGNFSVELWKKAFKDACERLCPIRAEGHDCGCLPTLARLVMEQLVSRLDVAMFNAILRESADEMPTDPVSDPIADPKVLPIPSGRTSFGAGAQLKNAIGSWSRWLTDLFGIEDNDSIEDNDKVGNDKKLEFDTSFKPFRLLNALSDLMMLPFDMLADTSTRKEVCPTFAAPLIKRVFNNFVPDEFCPEPIPSSVLEALDSENDAEAAEEYITVFPCIANATVYSPPAAGSLSSVVGDWSSHDLRRSGSSVLKKAYTSDDELDELDSPLTSIIGDSSRVASSSSRPNCMLREKGGRNVVRYQLLREVWRDGE